MAIFLRTILRLWRYVSVGVQMPKRSAFLLIECWAIAKLKLEWKFIPPRCWLVVWPFRGNPRWLYRFQDLAFNYHVSHLTRKPPMKVQKLVGNWWVGVVLYIFMISSFWNHFVSFFNINPVHSSHSKLHVEQFSHDCLQELKNDPRSIR